MLLVVASARVVSVLLCSVLVVVWGVVLARTTLLSLLPGLYGINRSLVVSGIFVPNDSLLERTPRILGGFSHYLFLN